MQKQKIEEAIDLTGQCLVHFWQNDLSFAEALFSKDIMWIGALEKEFIHGKALVLSELQAAALSNPACNLLHQEFKCILNCRSICAIAGRYLVTTESESHEIIQEPQRATFLWRLEEEKLEIAHMHISSPLGYLEEHELFPHKIGHMSYRYLQDMMACGQKKGRHMELQGEDGHVRFLSESDIEYAEAKNHNTITVHAFPFQSRTIDVCWPSPVRPDETSTIVL